MRLVALSVGLSIRPSVSTLTAEKRSHFQSEVFVCVSTNRADAVDRLLIKLEI